MPLELPAVTEPPAPERGLQRGELLERRLGARVLVVLELGHRHELVGEAARLVRLGPAPLRAQRERVLVLARDAPPLGHVLARLPHRLARVALLVARVDEAPAERRVVERAVAAGVRRVGLRGHERRPRHRLDAARDEEVAVAGDHGVAGADDRRQARRAEPVDGDAADRLGQAGEQRGKAGHVAVVLAGLVRAAEPHVLDLGDRDAGARDRLRDHGGGQVVGTHAREPAAVAADRRTHGREHDGARRSRSAAVVGSVTSCLLDLLGGVAAGW